MKSVVAKNNYLLLRPDGSIHYSFSKFLTEEFDNSNTRELVAQSLRILYKFCQAYNIEFAKRAAVDGKCLTYDELNKYVDLCYRPLSEIENASARQILVAANGRIRKNSKALPNSVEPNTAMRRLHHTAHFLEFYREVMLEPCIRAESSRKIINYEFETTTSRLRGKIKGTKQSHHHDIQSLPSTKFLAIIKTLFLEYETLFLTSTGKQSRTKLRDRAIALLACEGLRPGSIGNIARADFRQEASILIIKDNRHRRDSTSSSTPFLKLGDSTRVNSASETQISLWPITVQAIMDYINFERNVVLTKRLMNRSKGFLFLSEKGEPIKHRSGLSGMFARLGKRLSVIGLLDIGTDPYFKNQKRYDFYAYVLRHSSANLFVERAEANERSLNAMKSRYGWTMNSTQPERYAARALSELANIDLMEFNRDLLNLVERKRNVAGQSDVK